MVFYHSIRKVIKTVHVCQRAREVISLEDSFKMSLGHYDF